MSHKDKNNTKHHFGWGIASPIFHKVIWVPVFWMKWLYPEIVEESDDRDIAVSVSKFEYGGSIYSVDAILPKKREPVYFIAEKGSSVEY